MSRNQHGAKAFTELAFTEQGKAIAEQIIVLERAMRHHVRHSWSSAKTHEKCLNQVRRLLTRLEAVQSV